MEFTEKYISAADAALHPEAKKITISNDTYAIAEIIMELINKIEHTRVSLKT